MTRSVETHEPGPVEGEAILRGCLNEFPCVSLSVTGICMEPALREGQSVTVSRAAPRFGDIVLVRQPEGLRLHRLIWAPPLPGRSWRTKADRSPFADQRVRREDVLGVASVGASRRKRALTALGSLAGAIVHRARARADGVAASCRAS